MSTIKTRITQDLEQVKEKGSARTQKIREIVRVAVRDTMGEVKGGAVEIRTIAQDAVMAVIEHLKGKGKQARNDMIAAMEGVVAGVSDRTSTNSLDNEQQVFDAVDGALVVVERHQQEKPSSVLSLLSKLFNLLKQRFLTNLQQEYVSLQELLVDWDDKLTQRYGDRYTQVKQRWQNAQESYQQTKDKIRNDEPTTNEQYQAVAQDKAAQVGATVAQTERAMKQQLKTFLHATADKIS